MHKTDKGQLYFRSMFSEESPFKAVSAFRLNYRYTIKVWLTSILLGTTIFFVYKMSNNLSYAEGTGIAGLSAIFYYIIALALAVILSVPAALLFALLYHYITGYIYSSFRIKCTLSLIAQAVCWLSFYICFNNAEAIAINLEIILPYAIATFMSVFIYRLSSGI